MKPNWALVAILTGFVLTLTAVLVIVLSPPDVSGPELLSADDVTTEQSPAPLSAKLTRNQDGCFFVDGDFAIWPAGFVREGETVVAPDGTRFVAGDQISGTAFSAPHAEIVAGNEYLDRVSSSCGAKQILVVTSIG